MIVPLSAPSTDDVLLRPAGPADVDALLELALAFYLEDAFEGDAEEMRLRLLELVDREAARVAVAERDGQLLAFAITTTTFGLENGLIAELEDLYVRPPDRRRGIAKLLIDDSAAWASDTGCTQLELVVAPNGLDVEPLLRYYAARGFRDDGRRLLARSLPSA